MKTIFQVLKTKLLCIAFTVLITSSLTAQFSGGTGTQLDPYQVATANDLDNVRNYLGSHFIQTANIDLDVSPHNEGNGWLPIGNSSTKFTGSFNGQNFAISNLFISRSATDYIGLFGWISGTSELLNLAVVDVNITGKNYVGVLVGYSEGTITTSYSAGILTANQQVGGITGYNNGNTASRVGLIINSYSLAYVSATGSTGRAGGLVGDNYYATITNSYASGGVSGNNSGGLVGNNTTSEYNNCFWNSETSAQLSSDGGTGITIDEMKTAATFTTAGWDFGTIWSITEGISYPKLQANLQTPEPGPRPFYISTIQDLDNVRNLLHGHYILAQDLDFNDDNSYAQINDWQAYKTAMTSGTGFDPVSNSTGKFIGLFDGGGHAISSLFINRPSIDYIGIFGFIGGAGKIRRIGVESVNVTGNNYVSALVGYNEGTIATSYSTGIVTASNRAAGIAGYNNGSTEIRVGLVINCYSLAYIAATGVTGRSGGLVGENYYATITNAYASGGVSGVNSGGLAGYNINGFYNNSFWNTETSAQLTSAGGTGITMAQMMTSSTYTNAGWDFANTWSITNGVSYPWLKGSQPSPLPGPNPFPIYTIQDLNNARNLLHGHYKLVNDLDFNENASYAQIEGWEDFKTSVTTGLGFEPIGNSTARFIGFFDGNGKVINNLYVNRPAADYVGLFGYIGGAGGIRNAGLKQINIVGHNFVGSFGGQSDGKIATSYSAGNLQGNLYVGGLAGKLDGNNIPGLIVNSYSLTNVSGNNRVGGAVGWNYYATITNCYVAGGVIGVSNFGGLVGYTNAGEVFNCFWNIESTGQSSSQGGTGILTGEMMQALTFTNVGWDFTDVWSIQENESYPWLRKNIQTPFPAPIPIEIYTIQDLNNVRNLLHGHYKLMNDLDFNDNNSYAQVAGWEALKLSMTNGEGFTPIGNSTNKYTGFFDGNGHVIRNLFINRPTTNYIGLFGYYRSASSIRNLGLVDVKITGQDYNGAFAGQCDGNIKGCYATGVLKGRDYAGGITGRLDGNSTPGGNLMNSYSFVYVDGNQRVGGLAGWSYYAAITNCYAIGGVVGSSNVGGLVGYDNAGSVSGSFWNIESTGQNASAGNGYGILTWQMMMKSTFQASGWDFINTWDINDHESYPWLRQNIQTPYPGPTPMEIFTIQDLDNVRNLLHGHYRLMTDLDFNDNNSYAQVEGWEAYKVSLTTGEGFEPIGNTANKFRGLFDGDGHKISNLYINRPSMENVGLFGEYYTAGNINNLAMLNAHITGNNNTGILVGKCSGNLFSCYANGIVQGAIYVGGLAGIVNSIDGPGGDVQNCYTLASVSGTTYAAGFVGWNYYGNIQNSYASGLVSCPSNPGGFIGRANGGTVIDSYWNTETSGQSGSQGGTGRTTAQMTFPYADNTYSSWNFINIWADDVDDTMNNGYPFLGFPEVYDAPDLMLNSGESDCYESEKNVTLAGGGTVVLIKSGASLELVAKQSVRLLDGTVVKNGAYLHAWISDEGNYCSNKRGIVASENNQTMELLDEPSENTSLRIYPNPTTGTFTLELVGLTDAQSIVVEIYGQMGEKIAHMYLPQSNQYLFDLSSRKTGMYFLRVSRNGHTSSTKVILQ